MSQEFDVTSTLKNQILPWFSTNASEQTIKFIVQGSHGFSKEVFLVLTNLEIFFFKGKKGDLQLERRSPLSNYAGAGVMMGTLQITFKDSIGKSEIISIALEKGRAKEIQSLISAEHLEFAKKKALEIVDSEPDHEVVDTGTYIGVFTPETGVQFYERSSSKYSDRKLGKLFQGGGKPIKVYTKVLESETRIYKLDHLVSADVVFDGQSQVSRRPTLTRMGILSPLPGSALIAGFALGKKETHDNREVHVVISHPDWSLSVRVKPQDLGQAKSLASRINAIADSLTPSNQPQNSTIATSAGDRISKLKDIKELQDSGFLSAEDAEKMKRDLLESD